MSSRAVVPLLPQSMVAQDAHGPRSPQPDDPPASRPLRPPARREHRGPTASMVARTSAESSTPWRRSCPRPSPRTTPPCATSTCRRGRARPLRVGGPARTHRALTRLPCHRAVADRIVASAMQVVHECREVALVGQHEDQHGGVLGLVVDLDGLDVAARSPDGRVISATTPGRSIMGTASSESCAVAGTHCAGSARRTSAARASHSRIASASRARTSDSNSPRRSRSSSMPDRHRGRRCRGRCRSTDRALPAAIRVMSLNPPAASRSRSPPLAACAGARSTSAAAVTCGTWLTIATASSCGSAVDRDDTRAERSSRARAPPVRVRVGVLRSGVST